VSNDILYDGNHELWKLVQNRVNQKPSIPMAQIAFEIGVGTKELCAWIMRYKEPRNQAFMDIGAQACGDGWSLSRQTQRHLNWKRAQNGAAATLRRAS
jgi:hypothetical protein